MGRKVRKIWEGTEETVEGFRESYYSCLAIGIETAPITRSDLRGNTPYIYNMERNGSSSWGETITPPPKKSKV